MQQGHTSGDQAPARPRFEIAQIFRASGEAYRRAHALTDQQRTVMRMIELCRTEALGGHMDVCDTCGHAAPAYNSCRNRFCPKCQSLAQAKWVASWSEKVLPVPYFHVVFTLPCELRGLARRNQRIVYALLFKAASQTLHELGRDPKRLGAQLGITAVLHTWTRELAFHPHVHCIVTSGGLSPDGDRWVAARGKGRYLFPVKVLSRLYRGKFLALLERAFEQGELDLDPNDSLAQSVFDATRRRLWNHEWVVYAKRPFAGAEHVYQYLGRYTHRVGISNHRLLDVGDDHVTFLTKDGARLTLDHAEFIRRFLLHVLPPGFVKIRHYGLHAPSNVNTKLKRARALLAENAQPATEAERDGDDWRDFYERLTGKDLRVCPHCKQGRLLRVSLADYAQRHRSAPSPSPGPET